MKTELELTLEQQFKLKVYIERIKLISLEESHILLAEMMRQNMIKDNVIKDLLNNPKWAISVMLTKLEKSLIAATGLFSDTDNNRSF